MPIKKRTNPPPPKVKPSQDAHQAQPPGPSIESLIKEYDKLASDANWEGDFFSGDAYQKKADDYRKRLADGELWEVSF